MNEDKTRIFPLRGDARVDRLEVGPSPSGVELTVPGVLRVAIEGPAVRNVAHAIRRAIEEPVLPGNAGEWARDIGPIIRCSATDFILTWNDSGYAMLALADEKGMHRMWIDRHTALALSEAILAYAPCAGQLKAPTDSGLLTLNYIDGQEPQWRVLDGIPNAGVELVLHGSGFEDIAHIRIGGRRLYLSILGQVELAVEPLPGKALAAALSSTAAGGDDGICGTHREAWLLESRSSGAILAYATSSGVDLLLIDGDLSSCNNRYDYDSIRKLADAMCSLVEPWCTAPGDSEAGT